MLLGYIHESIKQINVLQHKLGHSTHLDKTRVHNKLYTIDSYAGLGIVNKAFSMPNIANMNIPLLCLLK